MKDDYSDKLLQLAKQLKIRKPNITELTLSGITPNVSRNRVNDLFYDWAEETFDEEEDANFDYDEHIFTENGYAISTAKFMSFSNELDYYNVTLFFIATEDAATVTVLIK